VTLNGADHYLGPHGTRASKYEYDRLITEWLSSGRSATFGIRQRQLSVAELLLDYLGYCRAYYGAGPNSELHRIIRVARPLRELYGRAPAAEFGVVAFKAVRQRFLDEGLSRTFINASMKRITRLFRWAASEGRLPPSVPQALGLIPGLRRGKTAARATNPVLPVDDKLVEATLCHLPDVVADMVRFHRLTGARPAEVCILRPMDVDRSGDTWRYTPESHKTDYRGRQRIIFVGPQAQVVLLRYLARDAKAYCFRPCDSEAKRRAAQHAARRTPVSCGNTIGTNRQRRPKKSAGERYTPRSYHQAVRMACRKAFPAPDEVADDANALDRRNVESFCARRETRFFSAELRRFVLARPSQALKLEQLTADGHGQNGSSFAPNSPEAVDREATERAERGND
jgi:integrase